ncbi:DUF4352 domain-containing protein [Longispora urticae]
MDASTRGRLHFSMAGGLLAAYLCVGAVLFILPGPQDSVFVEPLLSSASSTRTRGPGGFDPVGPVRDGDLEFTVTAMRCGLIRVEQVEAAEEFCALRLSVRNTAGRSARFVESAQVGLGPEGKRYPANVAAGAAFAAQRGNADVWNAELQPGQTRQGPLVFDVPRGTRLRGLEVHAYLGSTGATVAL